jgi:hypothetical protein
VDGAANLDPWRASLIPSMDILLLSIRARDAVVLRKECMSFAPLLACGPDFGIFYYAAAGILGSGVLIVGSGIYCVTKGNKSLGTFLIAVPLTTVAFSYFLLLMR